MLLPPFYKVYVFLVKSERVASLKNIIGKNINITIFNKFLMKMHSFLTGKGVPKDPKRTSLKQGR
jgi:hypothetical protein